MNKLSKKLYIQDVTLRDGMHAVKHQCCLEDARAIAKALDEAKVNAIEIAHGDGLSGSSFNYGFGSHGDIEWIEAVADTIKHAKLTILLIPGIGTIEDLKRAYQAGALVNCGGARCRKNANTLASGFYYFSGCGNRSAHAFSGRVYPCGYASTWFCCHYYHAKAGRLIVIFFNNAFLSNFNMENNNENSSYSRSMA
ncbi:MAG: hypothetical protein K0U45_09380 [Alphaproteobacteria bacterium]|nr:hypothetical protein [Alphaproteobacteria bacterium]